MTSRERRIEKKFATAVAHQEARRLDEAEKLLRQLLAVSPDHKAALDHLGELLLQQNRMGEALPCFQRLSCLRTFLSLPSMVHSVNGKFWQESDDGSEQGSVSEGPQ